MPPLLIICIPLVTISLAYSMVEDRLAWGPGSIPTEQKTSKHKQMHTEDYHMSITYLHIRLVWVAAQPQEDVERRAPGRMGSHLDV